MEVAIKINGRDITVEVSAKVAECLDAGERKTENLYHEKRRHWDEREFDEYIIATEGRLPYSASPEEQVCQWETWDEIMAVLALCTDTQRERFLLHALYDLSYAEVGKLPGFITGRKNRHRHHTAPVFWPSFIRPRRKSTPAKRSLRQEK